MAAAATNVAMPLAAEMDEEMEVAPAEPPEDGTGVNDDDDDGSDDVARTLDLTVSNDNCELSENAVESLKARVEAGLTWLPEEEEDLVPVLWPTGTAQFDTMSDILVAFVNQINRRRQTKHGVQTIFRDQIVTIDGTEFRVVARVVCR